MPPARNRTEYQSFCRQLSEPHGVLLLKPVGLGMQGIQTSLLNGGSAVRLTELQKLNIAVRIFSLQALYLVMAAWGRLLEVFPCPGRRRLFRLSSHVNMDTAWGPSGS
jgi:hypothetical protein